MKIMKFTVEHIFHKIKHTLTLLLPSVLISGFISMVAANCIALEGSFVVPHFDISFVCGISFD